MHFTVLRFDAAKLRKKEISSKLFFANNAQRQLFLFTKFKTSAKYQIALYQ